MTCYKTFTIISQVFLINRIYKNWPLLFYFMLSIYYWQIYRKQTCQTSIFSQIIACSENLDSRTKFMKFIITIKNFKKILGLTGFVNVYVYVLKLVNKLYENIWIVECNFIWESNFYISFFFCFLILQFDLQNLEWCWVFPKFQI